MKTLSKEVKALDRKIKRECKNTGRALGKAFNALKRAQNELNQTVQDD